MSLRSTLRADWTANRGNARSLVFVTAFRLAAAARGRGVRARIAAYPVLALYKLLGEWLLGMELPARTEVGPGLKIEHGYGLVVHPTTVIGAGVLLKHGVTLGIRAGGRAKGGPIIGDGVVFGPGAQVLGRVEIGAGARIGAGAIVLKDVPAGYVAIGGQADIRPPRDRSSEPRDGDAAGTAAGPAAGAADSGAAGGQPA